MPNSRLESPPQEQIFTDFFGKVLNIRHSFIIKAQTYPKQFHQKVKQSPKGKNVGTLRTIRVPPSTCHFGKSLIHYGTSPTSGIAFLIKPRGMQKSVPVQV